MQSILFLARMYFPCCQIYPLQDKRVIHYRKESIDLSRWLLTLDSWLLSSHPITLRVAKCSASAYLFFKLNKYIEKSMPCYSKLFSSMRPLAFISHSRGWYLFVCACVSLLLATKFLLGSQELVPKVPYSKS